MRPDLYHIPRCVPIQGHKPETPLSIDLAYDHYPAPRVREPLHIDGWIMSAFALGWVALYGMAYAAAPYVLRAFP